MIDSFFEGNSVSLEVFELFDDFCLEKPKKTALNALTYSATATAK